MSLSWPDSSRENLALTLYQPHTLHLQTPHTISRMSTQPSLLFSNMVVLVVLVRCMFSMYRSVAENEQRKLKLARGVSYSLPGLALRDGSELCLRVSCCAAIAPQLSLPRGRKIPANRVCQHLQVTHTHTNTNTNTGIYTVIISIIGVCVWSKWTPSIKWCLSHSTLSDQPG